MHTQRYHYRANRQAGCTLAGINQAYFISSVSRAGRSSIFVTTPSPSRIALLSFIHSNRSVMIIAKHLICDLWSIQVQLSASPKISCCMLFTLCYEIDYMFECMGVVPHPEPHNATRRRRGGMIRGNPSGCGIHTVQETVCVIPYSATLQDILAHQSTECCVVLLR
jgi:hypothetical protein